MNDPHDANAIRANAVRCIVHLRAATAPLESALDYRPRDMHRALSESLNTALTAARLTEMALNELIENIGKYEATTKPLQNHYEATDNE